MARVSAVSDEIDRLQATALPNQSALGRTISSAAATTKRSNFWKLETIDAAGSPACSRTLSELAAAIG
jgi:hypothetical protein